MKRMLINATHDEELRIALVDGQKLYDLDIESRGREQKRSNIYKARITRLEPSLEAAFVDFGSGRHGFLPFKQISQECYSTQASNPQDQMNIQDRMQEGQELIVQVVKEERSNKGAALTTFCSLAGRYLVLTPNNPRTGGISRKIEGDDRDLLKEMLSQLNIPDNMGVIVRTAGVERNIEELQWDLDYLVRLYEEITTAAQTREAPFLIYQDNDVITRAIRDYMRDDIGEVLLDTQESFTQAKKFINQVMPRFKSRCMFYEDDMPLFSRYQIERQIESAFQREVRLPSGGSLIIDQTEALVAIDINSARATRGADIEETALNTNLEAAEEICRHLRLRDIGGLVVIDFIDMSSIKNQRLVEQQMYDSLKVDRARIQTGKISNFGLMEMSRQRLRPSLGETSGVVCPRCSGLGTIKDIRSSALAIIRLIEEEALKESDTLIRAFLPVSVASFLINEKRTLLAEIEQQNSVRVLLLPDPQMVTPHYKVERIRAQDVGAGEASYEINSPVKPEDYSADRVAPPSPQKAAVKAVVPTSMAAMKPSRKWQKRTSQRTGPGWFSRVIGALFGSSAQKTDARTRARRPGDNRNRGNIRNADRSGKNDRGNAQRRSGRQGGRNNQSGNRDNPGRSDNKSSEGSNTPTDSSHDKSSLGEKRNDGPPPPGSDEPLKENLDKRNRGNRQRSKQKRRSQVQDSPVET